MARWQPAGTKAELWDRIKRQLRIAKILRPVRKRATEEGYVTEALRLRKGEAALRKFVQEEMAAIRGRVFGYRKSGGKQARDLDKLFDEYTHFRWEASGDERKEVPAGFHIDKRSGKDVVIIYARPWVPPSVVARLYSLGRRTFPKDVHGPQLKSLHLYLYVRDRRTEEKETWVETMAAWNEHAEYYELPNTYAHVSNFHRDYHRVRKTLNRA
jgi:hypothetical protein